MPVHCSTSQKEERTQSAPVSFKNVTQRCSPEPLDIVDNVKQIQLTVKYQIL